MIANKRKYWTAVLGVKLLSVRGAHGSFMAPSATRASEVYMSMADQDSGDSDDSFWLYKNVKLHTLLKINCTVYMPGYTKMTPTAIRMFFASGYNSRAHNDAAILY